MLTWQALSPWALNALTRQALSAAELAWHGLGKAARAGLGWAAWGCVELLKTCLQPMNE